MISRDRFLAETNTSLSDYECEDTHTTVAVDKFLNQFRFKPKPTITLKPRLNKLEPKPNWTVKVIQSSSPPSPTVPDLRIRFIQSKKQKKENINKRLRTEVWSTYMGTVFSGPCYCCNRSQITVFSYHCGHVLSEYAGGQTTLQNLRPICALCNLSGAVAHMRTFAQRNGFLDAKICKEELVT